jgi:hypothetical protein
MIPPFDLAPPEPAPHAQSSTATTGQPVEKDSSEPVSRDLISGAKGKHVLRPVVEIPRRQHTKRRAFPPTKKISARSSSESYEGGSVSSNSSGPTVAVVSDDALWTDDEERGGIDLSGKTYTEGLQVDSTEVPKVEKQVCGFRKPHLRLLKSVQTCGYCKKHKIRICNPTWYPTRNGCDIRCASCIKKRKGCSFRRADFGIAKWPTVIPSAPGKKRRKQEAQRKRDAKKRKEMLAMEGREGGSLVAGEQEEPAEVQDLDAGPSISSNAHAIGAGTAILSPMPIDSPLPLGILGTSHPVPVLPPSPASKQAPIIPLRISNLLPHVAGGGAYLTLQWSDLLAIEALVSNTPLSAVPLKATRSALRLARFREHNEAQLALKTLADRRVLWKGGLERLTARIEAEERAQIARDSSCEGLNSEDIEDDSDGNQSDEITDVE